MPYATPDPAIAQMAKELEWELASFTNVTANQLAWSDPTTYSQEARMIWKFLDSSRDHRSSSHAVGRQTKEDPNLTATRVDIVEALLTGNILAANPLPPPTTYGTPQLSSLPLDAQLQEREVEFWHQLGRFVTGDQRSEALSRMRKVLDELENRDILYSIAICRYYGDVETPVPESDNDRLAYYVAKNFVEEQTERSANQVFARLCAIASSIWAT